MAGSMAHDPAKDPRSIDFVNLLRRCSCTPGIRARIDLPEPPFRAWGSRPPEHAPLAPLGRQLGLSCKELGNRPP